MSYLLCLFIESFCVEEVASRRKGSWNYTPLMTNGEREEETVHFREMIKSEGKSFNIQKIYVISLRDWTLKILYVCLIEIVEGADQMLTKASTFLMAERDKYVRNESF